MPVRGRGRHILVFRKTTTPLRNTKAVCRNMENGQPEDAQSLSDCEQNETNMLDTSKKKGKGSGKSLPKGTDEYLRKRARNNEAVRKSRVKSKKKIEETQFRVDLLTKENSDLKTKVTLLSKELNVLRSLFANGGITIPENVTVEKTLEIDNEPGCSVTIKSEPNDHDVQSDHSSEM